VNVALIISNKSDAGVLKLAERYRIPSMVIDKEYFYKTESILEELEKKYTEINNKRTQSKILLETTINNIFNGMNK
jgi:folate-dependent phosphoribosylglycinamide formyltransferase PurN